MSFFHAGRGVWRLEGKALHEDEVPHKPSAKRHRGTVLKNGMLIDLPRAYLIPVSSSPSGCLKNFTKSDAIKSRYFVPLVPFMNPRSQKFFTSNAAI
jgi:hypothetical protein